MKKYGVLNRELASVFARLGHTDTIVIADCGLPIPNGVKCIDLSLEMGKPSFIDVLKLVEDNIYVEKMTLASEIKLKNQKIHQHIKDNYLSLPLDYISHEAFKESAANAKCIIRTGESSPFANVILHSGVAF